MARENPEKYGQLCKAIWVIFCFVITFHSCSVLLFSKYFQTKYYLVHLCYAKLLQLFLTLSDLMDRSPPGSSVHGILQGRILECVAIPFSRGLSQGLNPDLLYFRQILYCLNYQGSPRKHMLLLSHFSRVRLCVTP